MSQPRFLMAIALAVALLQIGFLGSMIYGRAAILRNGHEVLLDVQPVDPRDLLRGDYVRLGYNISSVPAAIFEPAGAVDPMERTVHVRLRPGEDGIAQAVAARFGAAPEGERQVQDVDIRGTTIVGPAELGLSVPVDYGIERFYLPEGEGRPIEQGIRDRTFRMKVAVAENGSAQIKAFFDGETLVYAEPIF